MNISLIAAMSQNRVIGSENEIPWHLPEDLKHFKRITLGKPVIMGRKTYESIGRLLPKRQNIILSRKSGFEVPGATVYDSLEKALSALENHPGDDGDLAEVFVIGGAQIYKQALDRAQKIYLTVIHQEKKGDAFFPEFDPESFREIKREDKTDPFEFSFLEFERKK